MNRIIFSLGIAYLFCCCSDIDAYRIPRSQNMGYLYDSLLYKQEHWMDCGIHDTINMGAHRIYCSMVAFVPYCNLKYANKEIEEVIIQEGNPQMIMRDTLHYGFIEDKNGEWFFPFEDFYDSEGNGPDSCQAVYRIQSILNHSSCIVQTSIWEDSVRYLRLSSLVSEGSNHVFWGLQAQSGFRWLE